MEWRKKMKKLLVVILCFLLVGCQTKEQTIAVNVDGEDIMILHKITDYHIKNLNENNGVYQKDGLKIYTNEEQLIVAVEITSDKYILSQGDKIGMREEELKKDKEFVRQNRIEDNDGQMIYGQYGTIYENQNIKVEYIFKNNQLTNMKISQVFDF